MPNEPALLAAAAENPGGSVAEIDPTYIDDPNGYVPPEAIRGAWLVDSSGKLTGEYQENPRHGVPQDDFSKLTDPDHWLGWIGDDQPGACGEDHSERGGDPSRSETRGVTGKPVGVLIAHLVPFFARGEEDVGTTVVGVVDALHAGVGEPDWSSRAGLLRARRSSAP
ncbi:hypothetical protein ACIP39_11810 [Streptomyces tibetensis]|uniref:hypothetical protein n=1 Tax=Streptomyces tibetensis TaxID=2382123 RepID=UPI003826375C